MSRLTRSLWIVVAGMLVVYLGLYVPVLVRLVYRDYPPALGYAMLLGRCALWLCGLLVMVVGIIRTACVGLTSRR